MPIYVIKCNKCQRESEVFTRQRKKDEKVIWILRPIFMIKNKDYELFWEKSNKLLEYDKNLYGYFDVTTSREEKANLIKEEYFESFLADWKTSWYEKVEKFFVNLNEHNIDRIISILPSYIYRLYINEYRSLL